MAATTNARNKKREINLDTLGAQRREAQKLAPIVKFKGKSFTMPVELPFSIVEMYGEINELDDAERNASWPGKVAEILRELFGDKYDEFSKLGPSTTDVGDLLSAVLSMYGTSSGESSASGSS